VDRVRGPFGWPSYVAKASHGIVPVEADGSVSFLAPPGMTLYFQVLDKDYNEVQRMRSVVQFQAGENRSCIGCHESRAMAPVPRMPLAMGQAPREPQLPPWGGRAFSYEETVQPVLDRNCVRCHDAKDKQNIDLTGDLDKERIPASYRTLVSQGWVHVFDMGYNSGGNAKSPPMAFGVLKSRLFTETLAKPHHDAALKPLELRALKCWVDLNCPLWPDYQFRYDRPEKRVKVTSNR